MGWMATAEFGAVLLMLLFIAPILGLWARRRWLSSQGGVFDCALRLRSSGPGVGWATGLARYEGDVLQWFRIFSLSWRPHVELHRDQTVALGRRAPDPAEAIVLFGEDQIVRLQLSSDGDDRVQELAMTPQSVTGLMSWLEAAPPGGETYHS